VPSVNMINNFYFVTEAIQALVFTGNYYR
jgi:hypothetical protein